MDAVFTKKEFRSVDQASRNKVNAVILSTVSLGLFVFTLLLNIAEGNSSQNLPFYIIIVALFAGALVAAKVKNAAVPVLVMTSITLMSFGYYLIFVYERAEYSRLFWFMLFPCMLMFCVGLRYGTIFCIIFFIFLLLAFFGPLSPYLSFQYSPALRIRFMTAVTGASAFAWLSEYSRFRMQHSLRQAMERLEKEALTDALTGLGNRRDFEQFFVYLQAQAVRNKTTFALAIVDIDHFKKINDCYGHQTGDDVLRHTARAIAKNLRLEDRLFRWGGEEFVIVMPMTGGTEALAAAERLRLKMADMPYVEGDLAISYTISIGLYCGSPGEAVREQMERADTMLYKAKHAGRNRVCAKISA